MSQTLALLVDAYRELNARKMFWISLGISALAIGLFALLGISPNGLTIIGMELPLKPQQFWYKFAYSYIVVFWWLSLGSMVLALISTASIFPELIASGSIDLYLSRPIGRFRLFLTKYLGGMMFVVLQVTVFAVGSYLAFGLRAGQWRPSLFLIIPLTTLLFSYLFAVCVLAGVVTRSTLAALLITGVFWAACIIGNLVERKMFEVRAARSAAADAFDRQADEAEATLADMKRNPSVLDAFGIREQRTVGRRDAARRQAEDARQSAEGLNTYYRIASAVVTLIPKTGETVDLLDRELFDDADLKGVREQFAQSANAYDEGGGPRGRPGRFAKRPAPATRSTAATSPSTKQAEVTDEEEDRREQRARSQAAMEGEEQAERARRSRSVPWIIGTSLAFELVMLTAAAWVFCRRDY